MSEGRKKSSIICPNYLVKNCTSWGVVIYCLVQTLYNSGFGKVLVDQVGLAWALGFTLPLQQKKRVVLTNALEELCDFGFAEKYRDRYIIDTTHFYNQSEGFEYCDVDIFNRLKDRPELFHQYILIKKGRINYKCTLPIEYFAKIRGVSERTIMRQIKELEEMQLICTAKDIYNPEKNSRSTNIYVLWEDRDKIWQSSGNPNLDRSVSAKYNSYIKHPEKFTPLTRKELIKQVKAYNERNPNKQKDLSAFDT